MGIGLVLLLLPAERFGDLKYAFTRLKPALAWMTLVFSQIFISSFLGYIHQNISAFKKARTVFIERFLSLRGDWKFILAFATGGVVGMVIAVSIRPTLLEMKSLLPWLPLGIFIWGLIMLFIGILNNHALLITLPYFFTILLLFGAILNIRMGRLDAQQYHAQLTLLTDAESVTLGNQYHYSLSFYHVFSDFYRGCRIIAAPGLLEEWNLSKKRLQEWAQAVEIQEYVYNPVLEENEANLFFAYHPVKMEINTTEGTRYYYFLSWEPYATPQVLLLSQDNNRFIVPISLYNQLFPEREITP